MTTQELNTLFGENLKYYRKKKGWTQKRLAGEVGTHPVMISRYEKGVKFASAPKMTLLAYVLDVDVWRLFYDGDKK